MAQSYTSANILRLGDSAVNMPKPKLPDHSQKLTPHEFITTRNYLPGIFLIAVLVDFTLRQSRVQTKLAYDQ